MTRPPANPPSGPPTPIPPFDSSAAPAISARRFFVRFSIALLTVTFVVLVAMLYYFWYRRSAPTSALVIVLGDSTFSGATVRVEPAELPPIYVTLDTENQFRARIAVPAGMYSLEITHQGTVLVNKNFLHIRENEAVQIDLPTLRKTPQSARSPPLSMSFPDFHFIR